MGLNDREIATVAWLGIFGVWASTNAGVRAGAVGVWHAFWNRAVAGMSGAYAGYVGVSVYSASRFGLWTGELAKDTVEWFIAVGFGLLMAAIASGGTRGFFRNMARAAVGWGALATFYLNLRPLPLGWELILQPVLALLVGASTLADRREQYRSARGCLSALIGAVGLLLLVSTARDLVKHAPDVDLTIRQFILPIWLTCAVIPFLYVMSLLTNYQIAFLRLNLHTPARRAPARARYALLIGLGLDDGAVHDFTGPWLPELAHAASWSEARAVVQRYRASRGGVGPAL